MGTAALAWLLAVFWVETAEICSAHVYMSPSSLRQVHYYRQYRPPAHCFFYLRSMRGSTGVSRTPGICDRDLSFHVYPRFGPLECAWILCDGVGAGTTTACRCSCASSSAWGRSSLRGYYSSCCSAARANSCTRNSARPSYVWVRIRPLRHPNAICRESDRLDWGVSMRRVDEAEDAMASAGPGMAVALGVDASTTGEVVSIRRHKDQATATEAAAAPQQRDDDVCVDFTSSGGQAQQWLLRADLVRADTRLCCRGCHASQDQYLREVRAASHHRTGHGAVLLDPGRIRPWLCVGDHGQRLFELCQRATTNVSAIALQRLLISLFTSSNWQAADDGLLGGKSASAATADTVHDIAEIPLKIIGRKDSTGPTSEPEPAISSEGSGSWNDAGIDPLHNLTAAFSPLLEACRRAIATGNVSHLSQTLHSTSDGIEVEGHIVKEIDPEPEPEPEPPEPEPEPMPQSEAAQEELIIASLLSSQWRDCKGVVQPISCSVFPVFAAPKGNGTCGQGYSGVFDTGAMSKPYCAENPLWGDAILLVVFAIVCTLLSLTVLVWSESRLRKRLKRILALVGGKDYSPAASAQQAQSTNRQRVSELKPLLGDDGGEAVSAAEQVSLPTWQTRQQQLYVRFGSRAKIRLEKLRYDYLSMLTLQLRSFSSWIVSKTWWDVTLYVLKFFDADRNYYSDALFFTFLAIVVPSCLFDSTLIREILRRKGGVASLKRGMMQRSPRQQQHSLALEMTPLHTNGTISDTHGGVAESDHSPPIAGSTEPLASLVATIDELKRENAELRMAVRQLGGSTESLCSQNDDDS